MPRASEKSPRTTTRKNMLTGNMVTRTKTYGADGEKIKKTVVEGEGRNVVRTKTKYPSGYKKKETVITKKDDTSGKYPSGTTVTRRKEKGLPPDLPVRMTTGTSGDLPWKVPQVKNLESRRMNTVAGKYRRKAKETIREESSPYGGKRVDTRRKNKENLAGFKRRQSVNALQVYDKTGRRIVNEGKYISNDPMERSVNKWYKKGGQKEMIKRADGSYSQRGLWDNIRANKGSGKKPTAQMLKQERKIKAKSKKK